MKPFLIALFFIFCTFSIFEITNIYRELGRNPGNIGHLLLLDRNGETLALLPGDGGYSIAYTGSLDNRLIQDIIAIEDRRFYSHFGIDSISKFNVLWESLLAGRFTRGGSTITEQYVKNQYFSEAPRTIFQKLREALWAIIAEYRFRKEEILRNYLETVYMGNRIYGIPAAIETYFGGKAMEDLSEEDIVEIITRLRFPNLGGGAEEYTKQVTSKLKLRQNMNPIPKREKKSYTNVFPLLTERIKGELSLYCNKRASGISDFTIKIPSNVCQSSYQNLTLSVDKGASLFARDTLGAVLSPLEEKNVENGAIYVWNEDEKKVLIYIGNRENAVGNSIDMIKRKRSVGSLLKPFLYSIALEKSDPNSFILDEAKIYSTEQKGKSYVPENYIPKAYGPITLKNALGNSLNSAAVRLTEDVGVSRVYDSFRTYGFQLDHDVSYYGYGIVLGSVELSLENIITGYRQLTNLGRIENFLLFDILSDKANRAMTFGESSILNTSIPLAVKTGTSTDFHDNWTVGYTDSIIIGVWVGNTDNTSMEDVSGVTGAGPIFHRIAEDLIHRKYIKKINIHTPPGVINNSLCLDELCFQKDLTYMKKGFVRKSKPLSKIYYESDFITPLTREEKEKWKVQ